MKEPKPTTQSADVCDLMSRLLTEQAAALTAQWMGILAEQLNVAISPYPTPEDPQLIRGIAMCLAGPESYRVCALELMQRAQALGKAAEAQGVAPELAIDACSALNEMLWAVMQRALADSAAADAPSVCACTRRLHEAMMVVTRGVTDAYFRAYQERVERDETRLKSFNRMVGHELKNPIATIQGAAEVLLEEFVVTDAERRAHFLAIVRRNAERAGALVNDLLALTTGDRTDVASRFDPTPLDEVAHRLRERLVDEADQCGVRIEIEAPLPMVAVDARVLELVLTNLIANAIRYSDLEKPDRYVRIAARPSEPAGLWSVTVTDNGLGIPAGAGERIFERFYRAVTVRGIPGTGLGLNIVQEAVQGWNGRVGFESTEGVGTSFWFTVPTTAASGARSDGTERAGPAVISS